MRIRDAQYADFAAIAALTNYYILHTAIHFATEPVTADELLAAWEKGRAVYPFLVAEMPGVESESGGVGGTPFVGYAKAGRWRDRAAYDRTAEVGIYVRPEFQGKGFGKTLYTALIEACRGRGFHTLVGGIAMPNDASVRLHEALGFVHTGTFREVGWKFERWHDVAFYQRVLGV